MTDTAIAQDRRLEGTKFLTFDEVREHADKTRPDLTGTGEIWEILTYGPSLDYRRAKPDDQEADEIARAFADLWGSAGSFVALTFVDGIEESPNSPAWAYYLLLHEPDQRHYLAGCGPSNSSEDGAQGQPLAWIVRLPQSIAITRRADGYDFVPMPTTSPMDAAAWTLEAALRWLTPPEVFAARRDDRGVIRHGDVYLIEGFVSQRQDYTGKGKHYYRPQIYDRENLPASHVILAGDSQPFLADTEYSALIPEVFITHEEHGTYEIPASWRGAFHVVRQPRDVQPIFTEAHEQAPGSDAYTNTGAVSGHIAADNGGWD